MNKWIVLGLAATFGAANVVMRAVAVNPPVELQPSSPGTAQTGNLNISGTANVGVLRSSNTVFGQSTAPTGFAYGGFFTAASNQARGFYGYASSPTGLTYGGFFQNASTGGRAVYGLATATTGFNYGGYFQTASNAGRGIIGVSTSTTGTTYGVFGKSSSSAGYGVYSDGNLGVVNGSISGDGGDITNLNANEISGGTLNSARLQVPMELMGSGDYVARATNSSNVNGTFGLVGYSTGTSGFTAGVSGRSDSSGGSGVSGFVPHASGFTIGVQGSAGSTNGTGVKGVVTSATGETFGGLFSTSSNQGKGVAGFASATTGTTFGVFGSVASENGRGVCGVATNASGLNFGGYFESASSGGTAVRAVASSTASGVANAVYGNVVGSGGYGVLGQASATTGVYTRGVVGSSASASGSGVHGTASASTGVNYGVYGSTLSSSGFGVFSNGTLGGSGTKPFRIDHPTDPEHKYLLHYSSESPFPQNFYNGTVVTDSEGYAWVQLPDYFAQINTNFRYQLTIVGKSFARAVVWEEIQGNRFQVRTDEPNLKVSWEVKADRNDRFVKRYAPKDVIDKQGEEIGKYQRPELYNLGPERGMDFNPTRDKPQQTTPIAESASRSNKKK